MKDHRYPLKVLTSLATLVLFLFPGTVFGQNTDLNADTLMATSAVGNVVFADVSESWPYLGSDLEKIRIVRDALKDLVYTWEADQEGVQLSPEKRRELTLAAAMEVLFLQQTGDIEVSQTDIQTYYLAKRDYYYLEEHIYLRFISIDIEHPREDASRRRAKLKAIEALAKLKGGADFVRIAEEYSSGEKFLRGRRLGPVPVADVPAGWATEVAMLREGHFSDVIELADSYLIVKLIKRIPAGYQSLEAVRPAIRSKLERDTAQEIKQEFFSELIKKMSVSIDHQAIANPNEKGNTTVIKSKVLKMNRDEYLTWAAAQTASTRRALRDPIQRELEVRRKLLLSYWIEELAGKEKVRSNPKYEEIFNRLRRDAVSKVFEDYLLKQSPSFLEVTDEDIRQYYVSHQAEFLTPEKAEIRDIIVKAEVPPGSGEQGKALAYRLAETEARKSIEKIKNKTVTFEMEALKFGSTLDPGGYFFVEKGSHGEIFDEVVFSLEPGQMTEEPVLTPDGYRVVQMSQIIPSSQKPLEHVREEIRKKLERQKLEQLIARLEESYFLKHECKILEENFLPKLTE
jgi:parvulin-like peptidyl-prolyl isomerase